jgi:multisubunit Na+/H+ antiporter MnhG subunit
MKAWKILQVIGVLALLLGVVIRVSGEFYGMHLALLGLLLFVVGRVGAWMKDDRP